MHDITQCCVSPVSTYMGRSGVSLAMLEEEEEEEEGEEGNLRTEDNRLPNVSCAASVCLQSLCDSSSLSV